MKQRWGGLAAAVAVLAGLAGSAGPAAAQEKTLTVWSHFADHEGVRSSFREVEALFESENPGVNLEMTFYEKNALFAAMTTALQAGEGPDVIYLAGAAGSARPGCAPKAASPIRNYCRDFATIVRVGPALPAPADRDHRNSPPFQTEQGNL